ncbi:hypothetical protein BDQ17DRAFT_1356631 [Cyathus striatus]|nr:hypothetical protein BDQ17DRAFT_1356631 [Cyathus striatus]
MPPINIILFGGTGAGKSSIVNMLAGTPCLADISSSADSCTLKSKPYDIAHCGISYRIHDTAGLDEGEAGRVPTSEAIIQLYQLLENLSDGVSLLIFCMRAPRIKDSAHKNWRLFHEVMCKKRVPICITITGLEQEENMDSWWMTNKGAFQKYDMIPCGVACITAIQGRLNRDGRTHKFDDEFKESKDKMWNMIQTHSLASPWKSDEPVEWFADFVSITYGPSNLSNCWTPEEYRHVERVLGSAFKEMEERCGFSREEVDRLVERLKSQGIC